MHGRVQPPHHFKKPEAVLDVITMISNPVRWHSRYRLFKHFEKHMLATPHVRFHVAEIAFGERPFEVTCASNPNHLQLRTQDELWHKENALNLLVQKLPSDWKYVAWIDADVEFLTHQETWAMEAIQQLQHYKIIQMFSQALDRDPRGHVMHTHKGFVASYLADLPFTRQYGGWHPGYGWAYTRDAWNAIGGMLDFAILGSGDDHMAKSLIGKGLDSLPSGLHPNYVAMVEAWQHNALATIKKDIGYLDALIGHQYHGPKNERKYWGRWDIAKPLDQDGGFNPMTDIKRDWQGLYQLTERSTCRRDKLRAYFRQRNEDQNT